MTVAIVSYEYRRACRECGSRDFSFLCQDTEGICTLQCSKCNDIVPFYIKPTPNGIVTKVKVTKDDE